MLDKTNISKAEQLSDDEINIETTYRRLIRDINKRIEENNRVINNTSADNIKVKKCLEIDKEIIIAYLKEKNYQVLKYTGGFFNKMDSLDIYDIMKLESDIKNREEQKEIIERYKKAN